MRRMLIIDDEQDICDCLRQHFAQRGFEVSSVFSGEEALARVASEFPDVILLDILLPGLSGIEVLKRIKEIHPRARIIVVTGIDQVDVRVQALRHGAAAYVTKPFNFSDTTWAAVY